MAAKEHPKTYRSFEQFKAELFPRLTELDRRRSSKWTPNQLGACMADEAIEELLRTRRRTDA